MFKKFNLKVHVRCEFSKWRARYVETVRRSPSLQCRRLIEESNLLLCSILETAIVG